MPVVFPGNTEIPDDMTTDDFLDFLEEAGGVPVMLGEGGTGTIAWDGSAVVAVTIFNKTESGGSEPIVLYAVAVTVT